MSIKFLKTIILPLTIALIFSCTYSGKNNTDNSLTLWYDKPAEQWEEALPLGNGRLGVMVFGKTSHERIQLNDDSMWPADIGWDQAGGTKKDLERVRQLLFKGEITKADQLMVDKFSRKGVTRSHQTLGELFIHFDHQNITDYRRELNLDKAISTVSYKTDDKPVTQKAFVSFPHRAIIEKMSQVTYD